MFVDALVTAVDDIFEHLGQEAIFKSRGAVTKSLIAVIKRPENLYEIGDSQVVSQVAKVSVKAADITPKIGDVIEVDSKKYKIFEEPLLEASTLIWRFNATLVGEK